MKNSPIWSPLASGALALLLLAGCATVETTTPAKSASADGTAATESPPPPPLPDVVPIDMQATGSRPVAFQRVIFNMEPGATIGRIYWGPMKIVQDTIKAPSLSVGSEQFALIARDELRKAHYSLLGGENLIFGSDESAKARFQLGAQIISLKLDAYGSSNFWNGKTTLRTVGSMTTDWQVFDTFTQKVVFSHTTIADHESLDKGESDLHTMFRKSLRALLAREEFAAFMRPAKDERSPSTGTTFGSTLNVTPGIYDKVRTLPEDFPALFGAVVTIKPGVGFGSGFIIGPDGHVLTAAHVVSGLKTVPVRLHGGLSLDAEVLRVDETTDVALLKLPGTSHKPLELGSESPAIGTDVYAIGNPALEELGASVTKGIVSGEREIAGRKFIQTDVSANPGNSGGPLLDKNGRVLGIISWKVAAPGYEGLSFAVPIQEALTRLNVTCAKPTETP